MLSPQSLTAAPGWSHTPPNSIHPCTIRSSTTGSCTPPALLTDCCCLEKGRRVLPTEFRSVFLLRNISPWLSWTGRFFMARPSVPAAYCLASFVAAHGRAEPQLDLRTMVRARYARDVLQRRSQLCSRHRERLEESGRVQPGRPIHISDEESSCLQDLPWSTTARDNDIQFLLLGALVSVLSRPIKDVR